MRVKSQKGSIAIFVLVALLFYIGFLLLLYAGNVNKVQTITEKINNIKAIYSKNYDNTDEVYNTQLAKNDKVIPSVENIPEKIIANVTELSDSYEKYGNVGGKAQYKAFDKQFDNLKELIEYASNNELYGKVSIEIKAYGNNGLLAKDYKDVEIIRGIKVTNEKQLKEAFSTTNDLYICIANNIECTSVINIDNINQKLDLNNCTISYTSPSISNFEFLTLGENANLTILDSSTEKKGSIISNLIENTNKSDGNKREYSIVTIENYGNLTIQSGKIASSYIQTMLSERDGTTVDGAAATIRNYGVVNLDGGTISCDVKTQACTYVTSQDSKAWARGIRNYGIVNLNSGEMDITAYANIIQATSISSKGKTYAYAYGILNEGGTINNTNQVKMTLNATADTSNTSSHTEEKEEISERVKTASE